MNRLQEPRAYTDDPRADCAWGLDRDWPRFEGGRAQVAVIGAGFTGLSAALHLAEAGVDVTVLEAKVPGWGASGRNGGFCCLGGAMLSHDQVARRFGAAEAGAWLDTQRGAIDLVRALLDRHEIDAQTHSDGEVQIAHSPRAFREFGAEAEMLRTHGIGSEMIPGAALAERGLGMEGAHGALHVRAGFALDPGAYAAGLARAAAGSGAQIFGQSPVTGIAPEGGGFRLTTPGGTLLADKLIVATNGYSSEDLPRWLAGRTMPVASSVLMTRPLTADERARQGWTSDLMAYDTRRLLHYFRPLPDGRFLFGMRGGLYGDAGTEARIRRAIRRDFEAMFPAWAGVETPHFWTGLVNLARSRTPFAGPIPGLPGAFAAMAYHGNGVAMGTQAGALVAGLAQDRAPDIPAVMRRPLGRFPLGRRRRAMMAAAYLGLALADRF